MNFEIPKMNVVYFESEDVITTSGNINIGKKVNSDGSVETDWDLW